jgi:hypothetical protein
MHWRVIRAPHFKPSLEAGVRCFLAVFTAATYPSQIRGR